MDPLSLLLFLILFVLSAFFSASEIALMSIAKHKVDLLVKQWKLFSKDLQYIKERNDKLLITILIWNNLVNVYIATLATQIAISIASSHNVEQSLAIWISTWVITFLLLMFWEIVPKSFATKNAEIISLTIAKPYKFLMIIFYPLLYLIEIIIKLTTWKQKIESISWEEIESFIDLWKTSWTLEDSEHRKIKNMLEFSEITVEEILTPRVKIDALNINSTVEEAIEFILSKTHSRIPVYIETIDKIEYVVNIRYLLTEKNKWNWNKKLKELKNLNKVIKIPINLPIDKLLEIFRNSRKHLAIVSDEYGWVAWLVTLEDIIEEVFWEIRDEYDKEKDEIKKIWENKFIFYPWVNFEEVLNSLEVDFSELLLNENEYHAVTLSYFITEELERFPTPWETIEKVLYNGENKTKNKLVFKVKNIIDWNIDEIEVEKIIKEEIN